MLGKINIGVSLDFDRGIMIRIQGGGLLKTLLDSLTVVGAIYAGIKFHEKLKRLEEKAEDAGKNLETLANDDASAIDDAVRSRKEMIEAAGEAAKAGAQLPETLGGGKLPRPKVCP